MSTFLPWSKRSQPWEEHAMRLRRMPTNVSINEYAFDPSTLAPMVGLRVVACEFPGLTIEEQGQLISAASSWSGGVYIRPLPSGERLCILNPTHSPRRNKITLMEEICHCYLGHTPTRLVAENDARVRDYQKPIEEEAYGVGAAVLLPWRLLFPLVNVGWTTEDLSEKFDVTPELIVYRIKICGATALYSSRQRKHA